MRYIAALYVLTVLAIAAAVILILAGCVSVDKSVHLVFNAGGNIAAPTHVENRSDTKADGNSVDADAKLDIPLLPSSAPEADDISTFPIIVPIDSDAAADRVTQVTCWLAEQYRGGMPAQLYVDLFVARTRAHRAVMRWSVDPTDKRAVEAFEAMHAMEMATGGLP